MRRGLESFEVRGSSVARVVDAVVRRAEGAASAGGPPSAPSAGLLFLAGELAGQAREMAVALSEMTPTMSWLIVPSSGVLSDAGEIEAEPAATGLLLPGVAHRLLLHRDTTSAFGKSLVEELERVPGATALVFLRGDLSDDGWLESLSALTPAAREQIFGGGTLPRRDLWSVQQGRLRPAAAAAFLVERPLLGRVTATAACRLISPLHEVTKTKGSLLLELDGVPALDLLGAASEEQQESSLILLALGAADAALAPDGRKLALRALTGIDPDQHAIVVGEALALGTKVAFAVRDGHAARQDLDAHLATLRRTCCGAAPAFGFFVSCAGRGRTLYGAPDVDVRLIKRHFPDMPFVGFHSTFEVAPLDGRLTPQVYAGVLGVFCAPS